jgi:hypothetical protein
MLLMRCTTQQPVVTSLTMSHDICKQALMAEGTCTRYVTHSGNACDPKAIVATTPCALSSGRSG